MESCYVTYYEILKSGLSPTGNFSKSSLEFPIPSLPEKITLKLEPKCHETFVYVNKAAFANPRVCITVSIQRRLSSVIEYLERKWKPVDSAKIFEETYSTISKYSLPNFCAQNHRLEKFTSKNSELWVEVRQNANAVLPSLQTVEPITSASLSLSQLQNNAVKITSKNNNDLISKTNVDIKTSPNNFSDENMTRIHSCASEKEDTKIESNSVDNQSPEHSKCLTQNDQVTSESDTIVKSEPEPDPKHNNLEEGLKRGWNAKLASSVTIGELFLMLGASRSLPNQSKPIIDLTYSWQSKHEAMSVDLKQGTSPSVIHLCNGNSKTNAEEKPSFLVKPSRLLSYLGMFTSTEMNRKQKGGRICNRTPPNHSSMKTIILSDAQGPATDLFQSLQMEHQQMDNGSHVILNDTNVSGSPKQDNASKGANSINSSTSNTDSFRRPVDPPLRNLTAHQQQQRELFRQQLDLLVPKYTQRKGRPLMRSKNIVSRQLPLQPKIVPQPLIKTLNGNVKIRLKSNQQHPIHLLQQNNTFFAIKDPPISVKVPISSVVNSSFISQPSSASDNSTDKRQEKDTVEEKEDLVTTNEESDTKYENIKVTKDSKTSPSKEMEPSEDETSSISFHNEDSLGSLSFLNDSTVSNSGILHFRPSSAASDNAMYDTGSSKMNGDHFLDSVLEVSNGASSVLQTPPIHRSTSPPSSPPSSHLNTSYSQSWLPELSLTSFLNNFGSSTRGDFGASNQEISKSTKIRHSSSEVAPHLINEDSQQSTGSEVDRQLISMMTENSVDFTSKFEKLASAVTNDASTDD